MMRIESGTLGCGVNMISGMYAFNTKAEEERDKIITESLVACLRLSYGKLTVNLLMFGDGVALGNGAAFADFITRKGLGRVVPSEIVSSPLHTEPTHKGFQVWLWYVDRDALLKFYQENGGAARPVYAPSTRAGRQPGAYEPAPF